MLRVEQVCGCPEGADVERVVTWSHTRFSTLEGLFYGKAIKAASTRTSWDTALGGCLSSV